MPGTYFRSPDEFHILQAELATVVCILNKGRTGGLGSAAVHANSKGYRITLNGRTMAKGKNPRELAQNFKAQVDKAVAAAKE